ncbi:MAG: pentapeptide repeat-containing protein [Pseudonocardiaceae bacterium]
MYVAQQLAGLLDEENQKLLHRFNITRNVSVDLSNVNLSGEDWPKIDFSWMDGAYLYGIDLRDARLTDSKWGNATLTAASLQCADLANGKFNKLNKDNKLISATLRGAHLQHANLQNADLRSVDLTDADLTGAYIDGARFDGAQLTGAVTNGVVGTSVGDGRLPQGEPKRQEFDVQMCKKNKWDQ